MSILKKAFMKKSARFRFYASLNDFLPLEKVQTTFDYFFWGSPTVKDAIQATGVPHTEVALVLVNGTIANFSYHLQPGDHISVYPAFKTLEIPERNQLPEAPGGVLKFIVDAHLGKLARYLRMLGFDTLYDSQCQDRERIQLSRKEDRVILTRDLELLKQNAVIQGYYLRSQAPKEQLGEVVEQYQLAPHINPFSRCMNCNGILEKVEKEKIIAQLEDQTKQNFEEFYQCRQCHKVYWKGSHYQRMEKMIAEGINRRNK